MDEPSCSLGADDYYAEVTRQLDAYKGLAERWHDWDAVREVLLTLAERMAREAS